MEGHLNAPTLSQLPAQSLIGPEEIATRVHFVWFHQVHEAPYARIEERGQLGLRLTLPKIAGVRASNERTRLNPVGTRVRDR
jgi:hypothetical protein